MGLIRPLRFTGNSTAYVLTPTTIPNDPAAATWAFLVSQDTSNVTRQFLWDLSGAGFAHFQRISINQGGQGRIHIEVGRATVDTAFTSDTTPFASTELNKVKAVVVTFDDAATPRVHMYTAPLNGVFTEVTYGTQTAGTGSITTGTDAATIGGQNPNIGTLRAFAGLFYRASYATQVLPISEFWPFLLRGTRANGGAWELGKSGQVLVLDESGNNYHSLITNAVPTAELLPVINDDTDDQPPIRLILKTRLKAS